MKKEKRHVGRPTNEEVALRNNKKMSSISIVISLIAIILALISLGLNKFNLNNLKGATQNVKKGTSYLWVAARNTKISLDEENCKVIIPFELENKSKKTINIYKIGIYKADTNAFVSDFNKKITLDDKKNYSNNIKIPISNYKNIVDKYCNKDGDCDRPYYKYVFYFKVGDKSDIYTVAEEIKYDMYKARTKLRYCNKDKDTKKKLSLKCPSKVKINKEFTCSVNLAGAEIVVDKKDLASGYSESFITNDYDKTKQSMYKKVGEKKIIANYKKQIIGTYVEIYK